MDVHERRETRKSFKCARARACENEKTNVYRMRTPRSLQDSLSDFNLTFFFERTVMDLSIVNNDFYLSGIATLVDDIDSKHCLCHSSIDYGLPVCLEQLMVVLRDGRTLIAFLRSLDQFGEYGSPWIGIAKLDPKDYACISLAACSRIRQQAFDCN